ncbi:MAG: HAMP domain-containing protein [Gemmatimonadetes bacterium]|nr:MAG: HAMP domain-containing protein [Gemmatimonadota bacterium]
MTRSLRFRLAVRFATAMAVALGAISLVTLAVLRESLDRELNVSLLNVAEIQASAVTDAPDGEMHFHEWELTPEEAASVRDLNRFSQIWDGEGRSLLRSRYAPADLPVAPDALRQASRGEIVWREGEYLGQPVRSLYYPLSRLGPSHRGHVLEVAAPMARRNALLLQAAVALLGIGTLVVLGTFAGAWWLAGSAVRPVEEIIDQAERVEPGSSARISAYADTREYRRLVSVLNRMLDRIERAFDAQKRFTADASHELRSPLTALRGELELALRRDRTAEEYRAVLASCLEEVLRLATLTEELLLLAKADAGHALPERVPVDLARLVDETLVRERERARERDVAMTVEVPDGLTTTGDPHLLAQALRNLVDNALKFTPPGGRVGVAVHAAGGEVVLQVDDSGPGLGADAERVFERFYQVDPSRTPNGRPGGAGLGLSIVEAVARVHGGRVSAGRSPWGGACFRMMLPLVVTAAQAQSGAGVAAVEAGVQAPQIPTPDRR